MLIYNLSDSLVFLSICEIVTYKKGRQLNKDIPNFKNHLKPNFKKYHKF